jgi:DNA polymerase-3 subunit beta
MSTSVSQDLLRAALEHLLGIVPATSHHPSTSGVLLEDEDGFLRLTTTDLCTWITARVPALGTDDPAAVVPARKLGQIAKKLPPGQVTLTRSGDRIRVFAGDATLHLNSSAADAFTLPPPMDWEAGFLIGAAEFASMAAAAAATVSADEQSRPALRNVLLEAGDGVVALVSTDRHRLTRAAAKVPGVFPAGRWVVPTSALDRITQKLAGEDLLQVAVHGARIGFRLPYDGRFDLPRLEIVSSLIDDEYPDYTRVVPTAEHVNATLVVECDELAQALDLVNVVAIDATHRVDLRLENGRVRLRVVHPDLGDAEQAVTATRSTPGFTISTNGSYLHEILKHVGRNVVRLRFSGSERPMLIEPMQSARDPDPTRAFVLMPLRTTSAAEEETAAESTAGNEAAA